MEEPKVEEIRQKLERISLKERAPIITTRERRIRRIAERRLVRRPPRLVIPTSFTLNEGGSTTQLADEGRFVGQVTDSLEPLESPLDVQLRQLVRSRERSRWTSLTVEKINEAAANLGTVSSLDQADPKICRSNTEREENPVSWKATGKLIPQLEETLRQKVETPSLLSIPTKPTSELLNYLSHQRKKYH